MLFSASIAERRKAVVTVVSLPAQVRGTVVELMNSGTAVDLNVVLDRLMNR